MKKITTFTKKGCPFCYKAKNMLENKGYEFEDIDITERPDIKEALTAKYNQSTVPYILVDDELIGGSSDLEKIILAGEFEDLLQD